MTTQYRRTLYLWITIGLVIAMLATTGALIAGKGTPKTPVGEKSLPPARDEYDRLVKKFIQKEEAICFSGTIRLYDGETPSFIRETASFTNYRSGQSFYTQIGSQRVFSNGKFCIQLDSLHKVAVVTDITAGADLKGQPQDLFPMTDKFFSDTASFRLSGSVSGDDVERSLSLKSDFNPEIQSCLVRYSPSDYSIRSVEIRIWKNGQQSLEGTDKDEVWISRIDYRMGGDKTPNIEKLISQVLSIHGKVIKPGPACQDYRFVVK